MNDTVLLQDIDARGVATVTLNRPQKHNAFDADLIAQITLCFSALATHDDVRVVVLKGNGKSFCAGGDLNWMRSMKDYSHEENVRDAHLLAEMFIAIRRLPQPLIGVIHGVAFGGGSGLAALCDYVIAAEDTKFGFTETKLGLLPATISPFVLEKIGAGAARAHFLSGAPFSARDALHIGLAHKVVAASALDETTETICASFLKSAPDASRQAKKMIRSVTELMQHSQNNPCAAEVTDFTAQAIASVRTSDEAQEGMSALLDGKKPKWVAA